LDAPEKAAGGAPARRPQLFAQHRGAKGPIGRTFATRPRNKPMGEAKRRWAATGYRYASAWDAVGERKLTEKGLDMLMTALSSGASTIFPVPASSG
jgi:hypothetical protein